MTGEAAPASDVVVVGAGVIGLSVCWRLVRAGLRVSLVGHRPPVGGATAASAAAGAMLSVFSEVEARHDHDRRAADVEERLKAADLWPQWLQDLEAEGAPIPRVSGTWVVAGPGELAGLKAVAEVARAAGHVAEEHWPVGSATIPGFVPHPRLAAALWLPAEHAVHAGTLLGALHRALAGHPRFSWIDDEAHSVEHASDGARVAVGERTLAASFAVVAAGVDTPGLLAPDVMLPPIFAGYGTGLDFASDRLPGHTVRTPNKGFACGTHIVPWADGTGYIGATNRLLRDHKPVPQPALNELAVLIASAAELDERHFDARFLGTRSGSRPYTLDGLPLVGPAVGPSVIVATGTYRSGFMLAPRIAELVHEEIQTPGSLRTHRYRPDRSYERCSPAEVLAQNCGDLIDALCEPDGHLPAGVRDRLAEFVEWSLADALGDLGSRADLTRQVRDLWRDAPIPEALPGLVRLARLAE